MANFETAIKTVLRHEGGYINDPNDAGGETKYGLSQRSYPNLNIATLTESNAIDIYRKDFWEKYGYKNIIDDDLATKLFDLSINMGPNTAHKLLQRALRATGHTVKEDGHLGPETLSALTNTDVLPALKSESAGYYRTLAATKPTLTKFLTGWLNRAYS